jgi:2-polyprenyl-3-methyl-5-hydroxy-6-metoxy-1,4-benzoquinol methylase
MPCDSTEANRVRSSVTTRSQVRLDHGVSPPRRHLDKFRRQSSPDDTCGHPRRRHATTGAGCVVCRSHAAVASPLRADLVECRECGLIYRENRVEDPGEYSDAYFVNGAYSDYSAERNAILRSAGRRLDMLEHTVSGRRLLDVGCAAGYFLEAARARGWDVTGLELSRYALDRARAAGLTVHGASILAPPDFPPFDVITLWDTIEHLAEPAVALVNARRLLRPNGVIAISTGDRKSTLARLLGRRWRLLNDPTHNFFFDENTLSRLLSNAQLRAVDVSRHGKWVGFAMILHQAPVPGTRHLRRMLASTGYNPAIYVNTRDVITLIAKASV